MFPSSANPGECQDVCMYDDQQLCASVCDYVKAPVQPPSYYQFNGSALDPYRAATTQGYYYNQYQQPIYGNYSRFGTNRLPVTAAAYANPAIETFAPCQGQRPWDYAHCYGYYGQPSCQFTEFVDMEDFMSNEKRKEKSRDAARCRRSKETEIFSELGSCLPLRKEDVEQLDKSSVMRLVIAHLKIRNMLSLFPQIKELNDLDEKKDEDAEKSAVVNEEKEKKPFDLVGKSDESYQMLAQALDGFLLILSNEGDVTYASESISEYLGIAQFDILGQQIWEYCHQCDHDELKEMLNSKKSSQADVVPENGDSTIYRDFLIRLKCTLTSRGRSVNIKSASYKVIHFTGHLITSGKDNSVLVAVGRPIPHPSNIEIPLGSTTFLTKHSLDMKFTYVDEKLSTLLKFKSDDLMGKSFYEYHHSGDSDSLMATFKSVISKGQGETCRYRFLGKYGGYCWIVTQASLVYDKQKPQSVVCVNYVISNLENDNEIYSLAQLDASQAKSQQASGDEVGVVKQCKSSAKCLRPPTLAAHEKRPKSVTASVFRIQDKLNPNVVTASVFSQLSQSPNWSRSQSFLQHLQQQKPPAPPQPAQSAQPTVSVRSEDMNKGFMPFADDNNSQLTMLKEEPDDLTHLAPSAGDACIPLDDSTPLFGEMLEGLILPESYSSLLGEDISSLDSSNSHANNKAHVDPFISYRDELSNDTSSSQHLLSPGAMSKSPEASSIPSLCSPNSISQEDDFPFMTMDDEMDLTMRAPYIPMNEQDDLPLLTDDLMWSTFSEDLTIHKDIKEAIHVETLKQQLNTNLLLNSQNLHNHNQASRSDFDSETTNLAALLCSGGNAMSIIHTAQLQQQQHPHHSHAQQLHQQASQQPSQLLLGSPAASSGGYSKVESCAPHLCDSMDTFENVYSKDDCWTMNDLLQFNANDASTAHPDDALRPDKQSLIINTASPLHVPLIAIQSQSHKSVEAPRKLAKPTSNTAATIRIANNFTKSALTMPTSHKRHLTTKAASPDTKRIRSATPAEPAAAAVDLQTSPHLLQHLMAPSPQRQRAKPTSAAPWDDAQPPQPPQPQAKPLQASAEQHSAPPASNSVLKNLLVSGCDHPMTITNPLGHPLLTSPPLPVEDSPPELIEADSGTDSGIDDRTSPLCAEQTSNKPRVFIPHPNYGQNVLNQTPPELANFTPGGDTRHASEILKNRSADPPPTPPNEEDDSNRKMSFSFLDNSDNISPGFLMDIEWNDCDDFLKESELENVLNELVQ